MNIKDITLVSVNWNQKKMMEVMLKSYVSHHYNGEKLNLILVDNGSIDGSKEWLIANKISHISLSDNIGHEQAINLIYPLIKTKYVLIVDTDIMFTKNVVDAYKDIFNDEIKLVGDYITMHTPPLVPRIAAWFFFLDIQSMREKGVDVFRDAENWIYDVGSWQTEKVLENGYKFYHTQRRNKETDENDEIIGMIYDTHIHMGKMSWDLEAHKDRISEVTKRRDYINKLDTYNNVDLSNKFK